MGHEPGNSGIPYCNDTPSSTFAAGVTNEVVLFVDAFRWDWSGGTGILAVHRYQVLRVWIVPQSGAHVRVDATVSDTGSVCPAGTLHVGKRPHVLLLPALSAGQYRVFGQMLDYQVNGLWTRIPDVTPELAVTVK